MKGPFVIGSDIGGTFTDCVVLGADGDAHKRRVREIIHKLYPDIPVILSGELIPVHGEYERWSTTALNAYLHPSAAAVCEGPITVVGHPMGQQVRLDRPRFVLREFFCPQCALRFATEVVRPNTDPPLFEVQYDPAWLKEQSNGHA